MLVAHQPPLADLFQTTKQNIAKHLKFIFAQGELALAAVVNYWLTTASDGKSYRLSYCNLLAKLEAFLQFNDRNALADAGKISNKLHQNQHNAKRKNETPL